MFPHIKETLVMIRGIDGIYVKFKVITCSLWNLTRTLLKEPYLILVITGCIEQKDIVSKSCIDYAQLTVFLWSYFHIFIKKYIICGNCTKEYLPKTKQNEQVCILYDMGSLHPIRTFYNILKSAKAEGLSFFMWAKFS